MKPEDIHLTDWKRILLGDAPAIYLVEVALRTVVAYAVMVAIMRLLGKRMMGLLTILEMSVILTLGAMLVSATQLPAHGLLIAIELMVCIVLLQRGVGLLGFRSRKAEVATHGDVTLIIKDGVLLVDELRRTAISREQVYAELRHQQVQQLGEVRRLYLEATGVFSLFKQPHPRPGLCILPTKDPSIRERCSDQEGQFACTGCGLLAGWQGRGACRYCGQQSWAPAVS